MHSKSICRFSRISQILSRIALSAAIFTGILTLMVFSLALIANGMITLPAAVVRVVGHGSIFVSDMPEFMMLFFGAASLLLGLGLILLCAVRLCPLAASYVYRLFSSSDKE